MKLNYSDISKIDLSDISKLMPRRELAALMNNAPGEEHYKLLAYFSSLKNNIQIVELGTHNGASSLALSINPTNNIRTYDVRDMFIVNTPPKNITRVIGNIFDINEQDYLLSADFIFVDTAHDGAFEWQVYEFLYNANYNGFIVFDDIHWSDDMIIFWDKIPKKYKFDVTAVGHGFGSGPKGKISGTGIVDFNNKITVTI